MANIDNRDILRIIYEIRKKKRIWNSHRNSLLKMERIGFRVFVYVYIVLAILFLPLFIALEIRDNILYYYQFKRSGKVGE